MSGGEYHDHHGRFPGMDLHSAGKVALILSETEGITTCGDGKEAFRHIELPELTEEEKKERYQRKQQQTEPGRRDIDYVY